MKIIAFFFRHSRGAVLLSVLAGMFSGVCNAALLAVINLVIKGNGATSAFLWIFGGLCALLPVARFSSEFLLNRLGHSAIYNLRMQLCRQVLSTPLRHLEELGVARLLAGLTDDIPAITTALLAVPVLCVNVALIVGCLVYMGLLSPALLAMVLGLMVLGVLSYQFPIIKVQRIFALARKDADVLQGHFRALTNGAKELKIHSRRRQAFVNEGLKATAGSLQRRNTYAQNLYSAAASWGQTLVFAIVGLILFVLPTIRTVPGPMIAAYALTLLYLMAPVQTTLNMLPALGRANVALKNTEELGFKLTSQAPEETSETDFAARQWSSLEFRSVVHAYHREGESETFVLGPINLSFRPGELVFIIGGNGSGKTTLVKLLTGLYPPEKGQILLNGEPIGDANKEFYYQHFSVVFSDFYLFEQLLGLISPELDDQAREYLAQLKLSHKVSISNGKLSTTELSQGQRKRLALLTAYLEDRPIYVFDEWAADQDPQFKAVFYVQILPELRARGKTVFVISHDDRYYNVADRIIKLDDGQVMSDTTTGAEPATVETTSDLAS